MDKVLNIIQLIFVITILVLLIIPILTSTKLTPVEDSEGNLRKNEPISLRYPLGTDYYGEDIFHKTCIALFNNIKYAFFALISFLLVGIPAGLAAGYKERDTRVEYLEYFFRKKRYFVILLKAIQNIAGIWIYVFQSIPVIIAITIVVIINQLNIDEPGLRIYADMILLGLFLSPKISVAIAERIEALRKEEYLQAAKGMGISRIRLFARHILWMESRGIIILQSMNLIIQAVMIEILLSYFRYGPDGVSLGSMISVDVDNLAGLFSENGALNRLDLYQALAPFCLLLIFSISMRWLGLKALELSE